MADFVAVIRKAVDGLANNTPETRSKVYEKARSAVVRQLENMKPRPPEELLNRQIAKLDSAISEVESEYAEALPALHDDHDDPLHEQEAPHHELPSAEPEQVAQAAPSYDDYQPAPSPEPEPVYTPEPHPVAEVYAPVEQVNHETYFDAPAEPEHYAPFVAAEAEPETDHAHSTWVGSDSVDAESWQPAAPAQVLEPEPDVASEPEQDVYAGQWTQHTAIDEPQAETTTAFSNGTFDSGYTSPQQYEQDVHVHASEPRFDALPDDRTALNEAADDIFGTSDTYQNTQPVDDFTVDHRSSYGSTLGTVAGAAVGGAAVAAAGSEEFTRYFDDAIGDTQLAGKNEQAMPRADADPFGNQSEGGKRDAWDDLEDLIGYDSRVDGNTNATDDSTLRGETGSVIPPNVYVQPKKNRTIATLISVAVGLLIAGGAYALYDNRAALNDVVGGLTESAQPVTPNADGSTTPVSAGNGAGNTTTPSPTGSNSADNGETTGTKFTQRLLADGTEKDEGAAPVSGGQPVTAEGVSKAEKNEEAPATAPPPAAATPPATSGTAPAANSTTPAVGVSGERMFLYEEVLGQSAPSAIPGTVAWSLVNEPDANGKPMPTVQAQLSVPDRGITALMTFKKNTDASLPASHIVEIVFSTGAGFEGGAVDSVQRIAMKTTEQDRGNALIAVPAKITDDFHMIALNDFPDALKTNLELLSTRDWLDIPLAYRNGRRALLTLQKGAAGKQAFNTAIKQW